MRNIPLFFVLVILFFSIPSYADDISGNKDIYAFSITPITGALWGQGVEIVYHKTPPQNNSKYYSQLLWDYKPLLYIGLDLNYGPRFPWANSGFNASLGLKYGLPLKTGIMEDRDWLSYTGDYLTNYSRHDAFSSSTFIANLSLGYSWTFINRFWLGVYGEFSFSRFSWKSMDGYTQYVATDSPWTPNLPKNYHSGPAINYSQNWIIFAPGISAGVTLSKYFALSIFGAVTPLIIGICRDDHLATNTTYMDYPCLGLSIRAGTDIQVTFNDRIGLILSFSIMNLSGARGDNYMSENGEPYSYHPKTAGGGYSFFDLSLGAKISF
jgi:hypothetical protein